MSTSSLSSSSVQSKAEDGNHEGTKWGGMRQVEWRISVMTLTLGWAAGRGTEALAGASGLSLAAAVAVTMAAAASMVLVPAGGGGVTVGTATGGVLMGVARLSLIAWGLTAAAVDLTFFGCVAGAGRDDLGFDGATAGVATDVGILYRRVSSPSVDDGSDWGVVWPLAEGCRARAGALRTTGEAAVGSLAERWVCFTAMTSARSGHRVSVSIAARMQHKATIVCRKLGRRGKPSTQAGKRLEVCARRKNREKREAPKGETSTNYQREKRTKGEKSDVREGGKPRTKRARERDRKVKKERARERERWKVMIRREGQKGKMKKRYAKKDRRWANDRRQ